MLPPSGNPARTAGHILLVEEYGALGAAFGALLSDAAPRHQTHIFHSLAEAEDAAREYKPDLLVIDIDPPPAGLVPALTRLKRVLPDCRVIIIAADDATQVAAEPNGPATLRFVKKPFPVRAFDALVCSLTEPASGPHRAALRDLKLADLLVLQALSRTRSVLQIDAAEDRAGEIHFVDGRISHAVTAGSSGVLALESILRWRTPRVRALEPRGDAPRTIHGRWQSVLLEALRAAREASQITAVEPEPAPPPPTPTGPRTKLLVIDDTELLLMFLEDVLSTADPNLQILTAPTGLEGVSKAITEKPDLILLDFSLPDITGGEVCRRLVSDERTARVPVIMMSGHVPEMLAVAERYENVVASIPKPFLSTALIELIERTRAELPQLMERRRKRPAKEAADAETKPPKTGATNSRKRRDAEPVSAKEPAREAAKALPVTPPSPPPQPEPPLAEPEPPPRSEEVPPEAPAPEPPAPVRDVIAIAAAPITSERPPDLPSQTASFTPAQLHAAAKNAVVLTLALEVVSMQFSPALEMRAIRARPISPVVSVHVLPAAAESGIIPEATFEIARVNLDTLGRIDTVHLAPTTLAPPSAASPVALPLAGLSVLAASSGPAMELIPAPASPLHMHLTAMFELVGVELSAAFRVAHLVIKWRGGKMRVTQAGANQSVGVIFDGAQLLLDRSAQIAEVLLDAMA